MISIITSSKFNWESKRSKLPLHALNRWNFSSLCRHSSNVFSALTSEKNVFVSGRPNLIEVFERFVSQSIRRTLNPNCDNSFDIFKEILVLPTPPLPPVSLID